MKKKIRLALKIDIDTYHGTRYGTPELLRILKEFGIKATFFATLGPDKSGKAVIRVFNRGFLKRMAKLGPVKTYGLRTLFYGTLLPAPVIAEKCSEILTAIQEEGHEVGLHAYDHARWQDSLHKMTLDQIKKELRLGIDLYRQVFVKPPEGFAAPGWQCNDNSLVAEDYFHFVYASDVRGRYPFFAKVNNRTMGTLQIPTTLPTFDELFMRGHREDEIVSRMISLISPESYNVLNIHPEFEGMSRSGMFRNFLDELSGQDVEYIPLAHVAQDILRNTGRHCCALVNQGIYDGRSGHVALQGESFRVTN